MVPKADPQLFAVIEGSLLIRNIFIILKISLITLKLWLLHEDHYNFNWQAPNDDGIRCQSEHIAEDDLF